MVTSKYAFEAVAGLEQIQRSMAGYGGKEGQGYCAYSVSFEQSLEIGCHSESIRLPAFGGNETRALQPRQYAVFHDHSNSRTHLLAHRKSLPIHRSLMNRPVS